MELQKHQRKIIKIVKFNLNRASNSSQIFQLQLHFAHE